MLDIVNSNDIEKPGIRSYLDSSSSQQERVKKRIKDTMMNTVKPLCNSYSVESIVVNVMNQSNMVSQVSINPTTSSQFGNTDDNIKSTCFV